MVSAQKNLAGNFKHGSCIRILRPLKLSFVECMNQWQALLGILTADSHRLIRKGRGEGSFLQVQAAEKAENIGIP